MIALENKQFNGGRLALAAARIAKGAASGGLYGAAASAVSSFLPEIIRLGAILLVLALLIPLLVFVGIPHIVFGYDGAAYDDVVSFTDRAGYIDSIYKQIESYNLNAINDLVEQIKSSFSDFDEVSVESDVSNTNIYWFIAINAVEYQQDLYAMNEQTIMEMLMQKLSFSAFIDAIEEIVKDENDEDVTVTIRTLKVSIKDLNPQELMEKLGFTDEEKAWAELLHSALESENPLGGGHGHGGYRPPGEALSDPQFAAMLKEAEKYIGYPYVYGGSNPQTSFDCSGYVCWVINQSGVGSVGRTTAQGLYDNYCTPINEEDLKPGDLIFFHNTYKHYEHITHVGIYVGENMILHAGNPIGYVNYVNRYGSLFCAAGRLK